MHRSDVDTFAKVLVDKPAMSPEEVFHRCQAAEALSAIGAAASGAMPALLRTLVVPVAVDCVLALRVAAAEAVWKVGGRHDLALPFLAWALKDAYWGVSRKAAKVLGEMGTVAHDATPDLVRLAEWRLAHGQFFFEELDEVTPAKSSPESLLVIVVNALGRCGRGLAHCQVAREALTRFAASGEEDVRMAAREALVTLGTLEKTGVAGL